MPKKEYLTPIKVQIKKAGLLTVQEVAKKYNIGEQRIQRLIREKRLTVKWFNKTPAIDPIELEILRIEIKKKE